MEECEGGRGPDTTAPPTSFNHEGMHANSAAADGLRGTHFSHMPSEIQKSRQDAQAMAAKIGEMQREHSKLLQLYQKTNLENDQLKYSAQQNIEQFKKTLETVRAECNKTKFENNFLKQRANHATETLSRKPTDQGTLQHGNRAEMALVADAEEVAQKFTKMWAYIVPFLPVTARDHAEGLL